MLNIFPIKTGLQDKNDAKSILDDPNAVYCW